MRNKEISKIVKIYEGYLKDPKYIEKWKRTNKGNLSIVNEIRSQIKKYFLSQNMSLADKKILDIGCSGGNIFDTLLELEALEENMTGVDIRADRIKDARDAYPKSLFYEMDATQLAFKKDSYDIVTIFTVMSSISERKVREDVANELVRVLKPNGILIFYDFRYNNPRNHNVTKLNRKDIDKLFPAMDKDIRLITLLPPLARRLGALTSFLYPVLSRVIWLRTHNLGFFTKRGL